MKRLAFLLFLSPTAAFSAVIGTAHDIQVGAEMGTCSTCHLPHQAQGEKLWALEPVTEGMVGVVSALCGSCHHSGGAYGALMTRAHSDDHVYGSRSHGQKMSLRDPPPATDVSGSLLPDIDAAHGNFECTTCHSVHDDTNRPFLVAPLTVLCARCHRQRHFVDGAERSGPLVEPGSWGVPQRLGAADPGSHPVGADVTGGRVGGPSGTIPSAFKVPTSPEPGKWSLGGHLTKGNAGGVTCVTCHAVHGSEADPDDSAAAAPNTEPGPSFLVVTQATQTLPGYPRPVSNGAGATSALCESCHGVGNDPTKAPGGQPWASPAGQHVNPGRQGTYSHPVDSYPSSDDARVAAFPKEWPAGDPALSGLNVGPVLICETCHAPHPAAASSAARPDVKAGAGAFILRAPATAKTGQRLCDACHLEAVPGHHPINKSYDSVGTSYLANVSAAAGDLLACSTCHTTAHGWTEPSWAGLDANWRPRDNGRSTAQADDMYNPNMSKTCMDCHYSMDGDGASLSPTLGSKQTIITPFDKEFPNFQTRDRGTSTHYIGLIHETGERWRLAPRVDVFDTTKTWREQTADPALAAGLAPGWARFGGQNADGSRALVCESCHELEPDRNGGFRHLLLAPYEEGKNGIDEYAGDVDGRDILCEACHGVPKGTHPLTGMIVSRTEKVLDANAPWLRPTILEHATMDRARNALSCDSCHQPHDANNNSWTYCVDAPEVGPIADYVPLPVGVGIPDLTNPSELRAFGYNLAGEGKPDTYATPTLVSSPHSGVCFQCHNQ